MKAILEMQIPENCYECGIASGAMGIIFCVVSGCRIEKYRYCRHPDCQLKIIKEAQNDKP